MNFKKDFIFYLMIILKILIQEFINREKKMANNAISSKEPIIFPKVLCTSVIRSTYKGESHGGVYLVDLNSNEVTQMLDWNDGSINWQGRGGDRGLRGIAFYKNKLYLAASDEIFIFDKGFVKLNSFKNKYLKSCHEIFIYENYLYLASTGSNSILKFDLKSNSFVKGYHIKSKKMLINLVDFNRFIKKIHNT